MPIHYLFSSKPNGIPSPRPDPHQPNFRANNGQLGCLIQRLKSVREGEGTLLDHIRIAYSRSIHDGNRHDHTELPILLAGSGSGTGQTARHLRFTGETPVANLWLSMRDRMDLRAAAPGDSTGRLPGSGAA